MATRQELQGKWRKEFEQCLDSDTWGQVEEACELYRRLASWLVSEEVATSLHLSTNERDFLTQVAGCLTLRAEAEDGRGGLSLENMKQLTSVFSRLLISDDCTLPFAVPTREIRRTMQHRVGSGGTPPTEPETGTGLPQAMLESPGDQSLSITIEKMGFKDATGFIDPFFTISLTDRDGRLLEASQDTPVTNNAKPNYVVSGATLHIQTPINRIIQGAAIFIEMKHFKPKKKKTSTKAWCLLEMDEVKTGPVVLEIYSKPTDFSRKKLKLLSVKPLYLHLDLLLRTL